jgi:hypothetical protein
MYSFHLYSRDWCTFLVIGFDLVYGVCLQFFLYTFTHFLTFFFEFSHDKIVFHREIGAKLCVVLYVVQYFSHSATNQ